MAKGKEVQKQQTGRNPYQQFKTENTASNIEGSLLRFTKLGEWVHGQDQEELPDGTQLIMGVNTLMRGWQKWEDNKPTESRMGLVSEGFQPPFREDLGDQDEDTWEEMSDGQKRDPWQKTSTCLMKDPKTKEVYTFSTSSKSGHTALGEVAGIYGDRIQDGGDPEEMPIVSLESDSYKHATYGKVMIPVFKLTDKWVKPPAGNAETAKGKDKPKSVKGASAGANSKNAPKQLPPPKKATPQRGSRAI